MAELSDLASGLGYVVTGNGAERSLNACPACGETGGNPRLNDGKGAWACHRGSCEAGGGGGVYDFAAWHVVGRPWKGLSGPDKDKVGAVIDELGLRTGRPDRPRLPAPLPEPSRTLPASARWDEFRTPDRATDVQAARWLCDRYGARLANALTCAPLAVLTAPPAGASLWRWARAPAGYGVAVPLYSWSGADKGIVCDFKLRWCGTNPAPGGRKEISVAGHITNADGLARFMGSPSRVTPATPVVLIVEGGGDFLAAEALRLAGHIPRTWAVIGLPGAGSAGKLGAALSAHLGDLEDLDDRESACRVVLAIDADSAGDKASQALFAALKRSGATVEVHRAGPWPRDADLGDRLKAIGATATAAELVDAPPYAPPPMPAVVSSIYGDADPMRLEDIRAQLAGILAELVECARTGRRFVLILPPGVGKTTAALLLAVMRAIHRASGQRGGPPLLIFALPNWKLAKQKQSQLIALGAERGVKVKIGKIVGVDRACHNGHDPKTGAPVNARDAYEASGRPPGWRSTVCPSCALRPRCAAQKSPSKKADAIFTTHASLAHLPDDLAGRCVVIVDEAPKAVELTTWSIEHLSGPDAAAWSAGDHIDALDALHGAWAGRVHDAVLDAARAARIERFDEHLTGRALGAALVRAAGGDDHIRAMVASLTAGAGVNPDRLPAPDVKAMLSTGRTDPRATVRRDLPEFYAHMLECVMAEREDRDADESAGVFCMVVPPHGAATARPSFERHRAAKLRPGFGAVVLDATGILTPHESYLGDELEHRGVPVLPHDDAVTVRIFERNNGLARSRLLPGGKLAAPGKDALLRVSNHLRRVRSELVANVPEGWRPTRAAVLTYRPLVQALEHTAPKGALAIWRDTVDDLASGGEVLTGYYGGQSRASNEYEGVDLLVTVGDPRANYRARTLDLRAMGLSGDELKARMDAEVAAELGQAHGRARAEVRPGVVVLYHIGATVPGGWDPGSFIEVDPLPVGGQQSPDTPALTAWIGSVASVLGVVSGALITRIAGASANSALNDTKESPISFRAESSRQHERWLSSLLEHTGPAPCALPGPRQVLKLIAAATGEGRWRKVGADRVRDDLTDDEGHELVAFLRNMTGGKLGDRPAVPASSTWWWPVDVPLLEDAGEPDTIDAPPLAPVVALSVARDLRDLAGLEGDELRRSAHLAVRLWGRLTTANDDGRGWDELVATWPTTASHLGVNMLATVLTGDVLAVLADLDTDELEAWHERAAIMVEDGLLDRERAERMALLLVLARRQPTSVARGSLRRG